MAKTVPLDLRNPECMANGVEDTHFCGNCREVVSNPKPEFVPSLYAYRCIAYSSVIDLQEGTMARQLELEGRRFWILSEPFD